jgi:8-oxo-dGTP diphosphatase
MSANLSAHNPSQFYLSLPAKRMGSGILLVTDQNQIVVVKPTYKSQWEVPGGIVEKDESPLSGALREVKEELNITLSADGIVLASLDYMAAGGVKTEALMFLFATRIPQETLLDIRSDNKEIGDYKVIAPSEATSYLGDMLGARVQRAVDAFLDGRVAYFEGQYE